MNCLKAVFMPESSLQQLMMLPVLGCKSHTFSGSSPRVGDADAEEAPRTIAPAALLRRTTAVDDCGDVTVVTATELCATKNQSRSKLHTCLCSSGCEVPSLYYLQQCFHAARDCIYERIPYCQQLNRCRSLQTQIRLAQISAN